MTIELGEFGIFRRAGETTPEVAQEVERLGFGAAANEKTIGNQAISRSLRFGTA